MSNLRTEDEVRDEARTILEFDRQEKNIKQGTGQITTLNQLGFKGFNDKPDGWYLPDNANDVAIILETKAENKDISKQAVIKVLFKKINVISNKYKKNYWYFIQW